MENADLPSTFKGEGVGNGEQCSNVRSRPSLLAIVIKDTGVDDITMEFRTIDGVKMVPGTVRIVDGEHFL